MGSTSIPGSGPRSGAPNRRWSIRWDWPSLPMAWPMSPNAGIIPMARVPPGDRAAPCAGWPIPTATACRTARRSSPRISAMPRACCHGVMASWHWLRRRSSSSKTPTATAVPTGVRSFSAAWGSVSAIRWPTASAITSTAGSTWPTAATAVGSLRRSARACPLCWATTISPSIRTRARSN